MTKVSPGQLPCDLLSHGLLGSLLSSAGPLPEWSMLGDLHCVYSPRLAHVPNSSIELVYKR